MDSRRNAFLFIYFTAFLNLAGIGLFGPIAPFLVGQYISAPEELAFANGLLFTAYSLFQFIALPGLGALSDRYGRRPVLLVCLMGSAIGYLIFGIGGALWVLFLGRIIDGITGGNIGTIYAYIADLTQPEERTRYYGMLGAIAGFGFVAGPALGGILARIGGPLLPVYFAAVMTFINVVWGYFAMPESLDKDKRSETVRASQLNPFTQLWKILEIRQLRWLLLGTLIYVLPFAALQSNLSVLAKDVLRWEADQVAVIFAIVGVIGIIVQGGLIRLLLKRFREVQIAVAGAALMAVGYALIAVVALTQESFWIYIGTVFFAFGNGLFLPTLTGLTSQAVGAREQGQIQGGSQSVQALGRVVGPVVGGALYGAIGAGSPYWTGAVMVVIAGVCIVLAGAAIRRKQAQDAAQASI